MLAARREGRGLYLRDWQLSANRLGSSEADRLAGEIVDWCRTTIGSCRRPWGIDHFDLTLAVSAPGVTPAQTSSFRELRPLDLYADTRLAQQLIDCLRSRVAAGEALESEIQVAGALFSWGDAAHAALPVAS
jgi:hypothetical protein